MRGVWAGLALFVALLAPLTAAWPVPAPPASHYTVEAKTLDGDRPYTGAAWTDEVGWAHLVLEGTLGMSRSVYVRLPARVSEIQQGDIVAEEWRGEDLDFRGLRFADDADPALRTIATGSGAFQGHHIWVTGHT